MDTYQSSLYDAIRKHVTAISKDLNPDKTYTLESLCGSVFWFSLSSVDKCLAGKLMSNMVGDLLVPFEFAGKCCQSPLVYRAII